MNQQQADQSSAGEQATTHERCLCCEVTELLRARLNISPEVHRHLANSRVEFLKAVRAMIDKRIEHLSKAGEPQGTKIPVE
jgi:hypothetical protein